MRRLCYLGTSELRATGERHHAMAAMTRLRSRREAAGASVLLLDHVRLVFTFRNPDWHIEPPTTEHLVVFSLGRASPLTWLSSTMAFPEITTPSAATRSPGRRETGVTFEKV